MNSKMGQSEVYDRQERKTAQVGNPESPTIFQQQYEL